MCVEPITEARAQFAGVKAEYLTPRDYSRSATQTNATRPRRKELLRSVTARSLKTQCADQALAKVSLCTGIAASSALRKGLLRELNPGPLAPEARIIPLDQAAGGETLRMPPACIL